MLFNLPHPTQNQVARERFLNARSCRLTLAPQGAAAKKNDGRVEIAELKAFGGR
jgi:hypothetical protein